MTNHPPWSHLARNHYLVVLLGIATTLATTPSIAAVSENGMKAQSLDLSYPDNPIPLIYKPPIVIDPAPCAGIASEATLRTNFKIEEVYVEVGFGGPGPFAGYHHLCHESDGK